MIKLTAIDLLKATIINQIDRKFILIKIPTSTASIVALVDQHAADERYRLETIFKSLQASLHPTTFEFQFSVNILSVLVKRKSKLRQWGIDIETTEERVRIVGIPGVLAKDIDGGRWKGILLEYVTTSADECPTGLMDMFCSKACRSVCRMRMRNDLGNYV
jgi:DNA mismatch repair ATPase MutL